MNPFGVDWKPGDVTLTSPPSIPLDVPSALLFLAIALVLAVVTRRRPAIGLALLFALVPFAVARYAGPTTVTLFKAGLLGVVAGLALHGPGVGVLRSPTVLAIAAALGVVLLTMVLSAPHAAYRGAVLRELAKNAEYLLVFRSPRCARAADDDDARSASR